MVNKHEKNQEKMENCSEKLKISNILIIKIGNIVNLPTKCPDLPLNSTGFCRKAKNQGRNKDFKIGHQGRIWVRWPEYLPLHKFSVKKS